MYHAQFVRFRASDNRRIPVAVSQVVATSADDAMEKLRRLVDAGSWPPYAEAVRFRGWCGDRQLCSGVAPGTGSVGDCSSSDVL